MTAVLVDGHNLFWRYWHVAKKISGTVTKRSDAITTTLEAILVLRESFGATHFAVAVDAARNEYDRKRLDPNYKAKRIERDWKVRKRLERFREVLRSLGIRVMIQPHHEADDVLASLASVLEKDMDVYVVSTDKDLDQVVGPRTFRFDPFKTVVYREADVEYRWSVPPSKVVEVQTLAGDPVDGIAGVPGIGLKTACALVNKYGTAENVKRCRSLLKPNLARALGQADIGKLRKLVELRRDLFHHERPEYSLIEPLWFFPRSAAIPYLPTKYLLANAKEYNADPHRRLLRPEGSRARRQGDARVRRQQRSEAERARYRDHASRREVDADEWATSCGHGVSFFCAHPHLRKRRRGHA